MHLVCKYSIQFIYLGLWSDKYYIITTSLPCSSKKSNNLDFSFYLVHHVDAVHKLPYGFSLCRWKKKSIHLLFVSHKRPRCHKWLIKSSVCWASQLHSLEILRLPGTGSVCTDNELDDCRIWTYTTISMSDMHQWQLRLNGLCPSPYTNSLVILGFSFVPVQSST